MAQHYFGGCQCGAVRFEVDLDLGHTVTCNCSRCGKLGSILAFAPETAFRLDKGSEALSEYRFNKNVIRHQFCKVCGIEPFAFATAPDGTATAAINVRCLDGVDPASLTPTPYDGASA